MYEFTKKKKKIGVVQISSVKQNKFANVTTHLYIGSNCSYTTLAKDK